MVSDRDLGWLAGFFDGEGCITTYGKDSNSLELGIANTEKALLEDAQAILDRLEIDSIIKLHTDRKPNRKPQFYLCVRSFTGIKKFFLKVPVHSKVKIARWNELRATHFSRAQAHSKARRARLARTYPSLL